jgi:hypothetical protein
VKKVLVVLAVLLGVALVGAVVVDRAAAMVTQRAISDRVTQEFATATDVAAQVHGIPLLTQLAGGSLDHVTVTMTHVPTSAGVTLDDVVVELHDVSTAEPRVAATVDAQALVPLSSVQDKLGAGWTAKADGAALAVSSNSLPVTVKVTPVVRDGAVRLTLDSVSLLGVEVSGSSVPAAVTDAVSAFLIPAADLPFGLALGTVTVVPDGVAVTATGSQVPLIAP